MSEPFDKIASVSMFEHVELARLVDYFVVLRQLLKPGGLILNHGYYGWWSRNTQLDGGMSGFIEQYISPGGEHDACLIGDAYNDKWQPRSTRGRELTTTLCPYALGLADALEAQLEQVRVIAGERVVCAYRLYFARSAMCFEQAWVSLF